jgi:molybdate transport system substrate-binding protein
MKKICWLFLMVAAVCMLQTTARAADKAITVSAAMSLKNAFEEIGALFEKQKGIKVYFNFGASGDLIRQIAGGAPVDVYASAAQKDMDVAEGREIIVTSSKRMFASNSIVLIVPRDSKLGLNAFGDLSSDKVGRIAICNPKTSPAGVYAEDVLRYYKAGGKVADGIVFGENVRQVVDYVARNEVDAGIVYATDVLLRARDVKTVMTAAKASHKPVIYPIAVVKASSNVAAGKAFIDVVLSREGQAILKKHGFSAVI